MCAPSSARESRFVARDWFCGVAFGYVLAAKSPETEVWPILITVVGSLGMLIGFDVMDESLVDIVRDLRGSIIERVKRL